MKKSSHFSPNISLLLEIEEKNEVGNREPLYKLDLLSNGNDNIENIYQNLLNMIFFKNHFLLSVSLIYPKI